MKLNIKKKYFDEIKAGTKRLDCRDAHITFICEETGEPLVKKVVDCCIIKRPAGLYPDVLTEERIIVFELADK